MAPNHPATMTERGAYFYFDVLRAVAASMVVIEHGRDLFWVPAAEAGHLSPVFKAIYFVTGFGSEAVTAFFVLSGFWITKTVGRRMDTAGFWRAYLLDRWSRLWIVIIPALAIGGLLDSVGCFALDAPLYRGATGTIVLAYDVAQRLSLGTLIGNVAFLQTIAVPTFGSNGPFWSLANEFW
jgi:peptidoglycan/LPS O-acetylase OafA/YrhL